MQHTAANSDVKAVIGRPFTRGDRRINRRGRPKNFDAFRELCQKICHEKVTVNGEVMTRLENILRDWAGSKDAQKQIALIQYGYGKPADKIESELFTKKSITLYYNHERPDLPQPDGPITAVNGEGTRDRYLAKFANGA